jgi:hypothetical protein
MRSSTAFTVWSSSSSTAFTVWSWARHSGYWPIQGVAGSARQPELARHSQIPWSVWGLSLYMDSVWGLSLYMDSVWGLSLYMDSVWGLSLYMD